MSAEQEESRETEIRLLVDSKTARRIIAQLSEDGVPRRVVQRDEYFDATWGSFVAESPITTWIRLREENAAFVLTRKVFVYGADGFALHAVESSMRHIDAEVLRATLATLGYVHLVTVTKLRTSFSPSCSLEISVDSVKGLGWFVEIESTDEHLGAIEVRAQLEVVAESLGLSVELQDRSGYPLLLLKRLGKV